MVNAGIASSQNRNTAADTSNNISSTSSMSSCVLWIVNLSFDQVCLLGYLRTWRRLSRSIGGDEIPWQHRDCCKYEYPYKPLFLIPRHTLRRKKFEDLSNIGCPYW